MYQAKIKVQESLQSQMLEQCHEKMRNQRINKERQEVGLSVGDSVFYKTHMRQ